MTPVRALAFLLAAMLCACAQQGAGPSQAVELPTPPAGAVELEPLAQLKPATRAAPIELAAAPALVPVPSEPVAALPAKPAAKAAVPAPVVARVAPPIVADPVMPVAPPQPRLDLAELRTRLRDTEAIGLLAKLELRSQVDDLVKQFRAHHQGKAKAGLASLRQTYNALISKVLGMIRGDPSLASTLSASREAIWTILEDPVKFEEAN